MFQPPLTPGCTGLIHNILSGLPRARGKSVQKIIVTFQLATSLFFVIFIILEIIPHEFVAQKYVLSENVFSSLKDVSNNKNKPAPVSPIVKFQISTLGS